jgi:hypothetical protein
MFVLGLVAMLPSYPARTGAAWRVRIMRTLCWLVVLPSRIRDLILMFVLGLVAMLPSLPSRTGAA